MSGAPRLALGTAQFGLAYGIAGTGYPVAPDEVRAILELAAERGVRRIDTAAAYGDIEARLSDLISGLPFTVVSKIPAPPAEATPAEQIAFTVESIRLSKARLGAALVGILFHDPDALSEAHGRETAEAALRQCADADIALGLSGYDPDKASQTVRAFSLAMAQVPANALDQRLARAASTFGDAEVTTRSIFLQGLLLMDPEAAAKKLPKARPLLVKWSGWAASRGLPPMHAAIAVARSFPCDYCVVGVESRRQLLEILDAWDRPAIEAPELASDEIAVIDPRRWPN